MYIKNEKETLILLNFKAMESPTKKPVTDSRPKDNVQHPSSDDKSVNTESKPSGGGCSDPECPYKTQDTNK
nr:hypothetical protein TDPV-075 [Oriental turtle dovepox virus]